jgi:hypothetical protein
MTVAELLDRTDARELAEWMAFDAVEPVGDARTDYQAAMQALVVARAAGSTRSRLRHFLPDWWGESDDRKPQTQDEMQRAMLRFAATFEDSPACPPLSGNSPHS